MDCKKEKINEMWTISEEKRPMAIGIILILALFVFFISNQNFIITILMVFSVAGIYGELESGLVRKIIDDQKPDDNEDPNFLVEEDSDIHSRTQNWHVKKDEKICFIGDGVIKIRVCSGKDFKEHFEDTIWQLTTEEEIRASIAAKKGNKIQTEDEQIEDDHIEITATNWWKIKPNDNDLFNWTAETFPSREVYFNKPKPDQPLFFTAEDDVTIHSENGEQQSIKKGETIFLGGNGKIRIQFHSKGKVEDTIWKLATDKEANDANIKVTYWSRITPNKDDSMTLDGQFDWISNIFSSKEVFFGRPDPNQGTIFPATGFERTIETQNWDEIIRKGETICLVGNGLIRIKIYSGKNRTKPEDTIWKLTSEKEAQNVNATHWWKISQNGDDLFFSNREEFPSKEVCLDSPKPNQPSVYTAVQDVIIRTQNWEQAMKNGETTCLIGNGKIRIKFCSGKDFKNVNETIWRLTPKTESQNETASYWWKITPNPNNSFASDGKPISDPRQEPIFTAKQRLTIQAQNWRQNMEKDETICLVGDGEIEIEVISNHNSMKRIWRLTPTNEAQNEDAKYWWYIWPSQSDLFDSKGRPYPNKNMCLDIQN